MQEIEKLLQEVSKLSKEFDAVHENKIEQFNVFDILDIETDERKICRFLCEIISPAKALRNGFLERDFFLKSFVKKVLKLDIPDYKLEKAEVCREYITENGRRIDIVIRSEKESLFIPIEVKIWAWDLNRQCKDYYDEAKKHDADAKIFYLTPNGKLPSPESADGVPTENMKCISFENDIYDWISYCIGQSEVIRNAPIREVLLQFAATVKKFTDQTMEEQLKMEIAELIGKSTENLKAAGEIISALGTVLQTRLFEFVEKMLEKEYKPENTDFYYKNQFKGARGLFYHNGEHDNATPGVRFDVEYWYGGLWAFIGEFTLQGSKWGNNGRCGVNGHYVDFSNVEHLCELCDEENMKKFAGNCAEKIREYLKNVNSSQQNA